MGYRVLSIYLLLLIVLSLLVPVTLTLTSNSSGARGFSRGLCVYAPAVTRSGNGVLIRINLTLVYPGHGYVYFSAKPLVEPDTQATARIAAYVAATITGHDYYSYDYYVVMTSNSIIVGGPSAGALMTIGFIALFMNKTINSYVTMTGMINPDGSIGPVGGLLGKLHAVADAGYKYFLIPLGQRIFYVEERIVKKFFWGYYETVKYVPVDLYREGEKLGVRVVEVGSILDALKYFLNTTINYNYAEPTSINESIYDIIGNYTLRNYYEVQRLYNESRNLYNKLDFFTKLEVGDELDNARNSYETLRHMIMENHILAAYQYSFEALRINIYVNWLFKSLLNRLDINTIFTTLNETMNTTYNMLLNTSSRGLNPLILEAHRHYYQALTRYGEVISRSGKSISSGVLRDLAGIAVDLYMADQYIALSKYFKYSSIRVNDTFITLYSLADSVVSYAYSLVNDIGGSNTYINNAVNSFGEAMNAYRDNYTLASISLLIDTIVYADMGIEALFIQNQTVYHNLTNYLLLEHSYYYILTNMKNYMIYTRLISQDYIGMNKYVDALKYLLKGIMYASIFRMNTTIPNNTLIQTYTPKPPINPVKTPATPRNKSSTPKETIKLPGNTGLTSILTYYILGLITGFAVGIAVYYIYNSSARRKRYEYVGF